MRTRVVALLLGMMALLLAPLPAAQGAPADCPDVPLKQSLRAAEAVLVGQVTGSTEVGASWDAEVSLAWAYKGDPLSSTITIRTSTGSCGLGRLTKGETYLFVLTEKRGMYVASGFGDTAPLTSQLRRTVRSVLGQGEAVGNSEPPTPVEVTLTRVGGDSQASFWHAALPGLAILGVALIGWIVLRRLAQP
ncbi:MAG: hypothetical protein ACSLEW_00060 [Nocardioides sp.]